MDGTKIMKQLEDALTNRLLTSEAVRKEIEATGYGFALNDRNAFKQYYVAFPWPWLKEVNYAIDDDVIAHIIETVASNCAIKIFNHKGYASSEMHRGVEQMRFGITENNSQRYFTLYSVNPDIVLLETVREYSRIEGLKPFLEGVREYARLAHITYDAIWNGVNSYERGRDVDWFDEQIKEIENGRLEQIH